MNMTDDDAQRIADALNVPMHVVADVKRDRLWRVKRWARIVKRRYGRWQAQR